MVVAWCFSGAALFPLTGNLQHVNNAHMGANDWVLLKFQSYKCSHFSLEVLTTLFFMVQHQYLLPHQAYNMHHKFMILLTFDPEINIVLTFLPSFQKFLTQPRKSTDHVLDHFILEPFSFHIIADSTCLHNAW